MSSETKLTKDEDGESVDRTKYRGMIGSLLYLMASRPEIMLLFGFVLDFKRTPKHLTLKLSNESLDILREQYT